METGSNLGIAFLLVFIAGLSTALGAAIVCTPCMAHLATPRFLAGGLSLSAGVMVYVSFVEILQKCLTSFGDAGHSHGTANALTTLCFFCGAGFVLILDKIVHAILHRINHSHEHIPSAVNAPGGAVMSVSAGSKSNPLARCHGVCVSDLGNILGQLEQEGRDLGLETGWEDGVSGDASTMNLDVDLSDESGNSKAAPEAACKADVDPDVEFGKALYKVKDNNGRVPKTVESFNETCGSSSMDINLEIGHGVEFRQTLYKVKDSNDRVCKSGYSERGSVGSASLDLDLDVESREPRRSARNARTLYKVTDKNGRVCKTVQSDDEKEDVDFDEGDKVMDKLSKTVCRTGRSKIDEKPNAKEGKKKKAHITFDESSSDALRKSREEEEKVQRRHLMQTSLQTALAITIHNFPEGLATFVAAMSDPKVGFVLAIAIAVHNIPEGLCVALPVYFATKSKWRAFGYALASGLSEPFAALLAWLILGNAISDDLYAILFGFVAGMMVIISVRELLPTAHRYDEGDTIVTKCFCVGMFVMAASLVLFSL